MSKLPALPIGLPGGELMPHMSARARTRTIDALFEASGGFERALAWIEKTDDNFGEFFTKIWAKGAAKPLTVEHHTSEGVEALLEKLDLAERETIDITPRDVT